MGADMQSVYCVPIDETGEEIKEDPVLELPLGNMYSKEESTNTLLRMLLNFGGISVLIIMTMFGTPFFYKFFISDIIKTEQDEINVGDTTKIGKKDRLASSEILASILILLTSLTLISGFAINDQLGGMLGVFITIIFFIAFARIQFEKMSKPVSNFYKEYLEITDNTNEYGKQIRFKNVMDIIKWLRYQTSLVPLACIYIVELLCFFLPFYILPKITPNTGIILIATWLPFYLNVLLFKTKNNQNTTS